MDVEIIVFSFYDEILWRTFFCHFSNNFVSDIFRIFWYRVYKEYMFFTIYFIFIHVHFGIFFYEILFCIFLLFPLQNIYIIIVYF